MQSVIAFILILISSLLVYKVSTRFITATPPKKKTSPGQAIGAFITTLLLFPCGVFLLIAGASTVPHQIGVAFFGIGFIVLVLALILGIPKIFKQ